MKDQAEELYNMTLHSEIKIHSDLFAIRVPGGWIYQSIAGDEESSVSTSSTFVPFCLEFAP